MKNVKSLVLLVASAALLSACGTKPATTSSATSSAGSSQESVVYTGTSRNVKINFEGNANLVGCAVISQGYGDYLTYRYTPKTGTKFYVVPSFIGANELDYVTLGGVRYEAQVGAKGFSFKDASGSNEISLEGVRYAEVTMPEGDSSMYPGQTVEIFSKAVAGATLHTLTLEVNNTTGYALNNYIGSKGTVTGQFIEGSFASFTIEGDIVKDGDGEDVDTIDHWLGDYEKGITAECNATLSTNVEGCTVSHNTLESSIRNLMRTSGNLVMPKSDVTVTCTYAKNAA